MSGKKYLGILAAAAGLAAAATIGITVLVDPYWLFGSPALDGVNALKPNAENQAMMAKTALIERAAPRTLLLGNSRIEVGIDPESDQWPADARPVFNAGQAGHDLATAYREFQHAIAVTPPRLVVVGLDFVDFTARVKAPGAASSASADERRLLVDRSGSPNAERRAQVWRDYLTATLTVDALIDSVTTLLGQDATYGATMTRLGFRPLNDFRRHAERIGYHGLFAQKTAAYERQFRALRRLDYGEPAQIEGFRALQQIIDLAAINRIGVVLFIHPYHVELLELLHRLDLWPSFESWKRALANYVAAAAKQTAQPIALIDFARYDEENMEPVPPVGDTATKMRWYWEAGHYKARLGNLVVERFFNPGASFGYTLSPATLESDLSGVRSGRAHYLARRAGAASR